LKTNQAFFSGGPDLTADQKLIVVCQYKPAGKKRDHFSLTKGSSGGWRSGRADEEDWRSLAEKVRCFASNLTKLSFSIPECNALFIFE
jgi:hypothetical protein